MSRRTPIPSLRQFGLYLALLAPLATTTGCPQAGAAIGAGTPRSEPMKVGLDGPLPVIGEKVSVLVTRPAGPPYEWLEPEWLDGRYLGVREGALLLSTNRGERAIAFGSIRELRVHRGGSHSEGGLVVSAVIGSILVVAGVVLVGAVLVASWHGGPR